MLQEAYGTHFGPIGKQKKTVKIVKQILKTGKCNMEEAVLTYIGKVHVKSVYEPSGSSGRSLSRFQ